MTEASRPGGLLLAVLCAVALSMLMAGCGIQLGGDDSKGGKGERAVDSRDAVESATVKIETDGVQTDPQYGTPEEVEGGGTGFIIRPSGLVVTNNHVVTGAAALDVYVGGDEEPVNAEVLGSSECSDLAVLQLDQKKLPYLEWHEGEIQAGLDVYTMGFPFGEPFTVTRGIVSKAEADGETVWASVESVIEHDSTINPGNSGGPLVDDKGKLVGVNYASDPNNRYYAIGRDEAQKTIDQLKEGKDVDSLGVNGQAFVLDENGDGVVDEGETVEASGVYVYSVETGSPAGEAGIKGGDVILSLEDVPLAEDGTMSEYCKILRTNPGDPLKAQVLRLETEEILEGEINGKALEVVETAPPPNDGGDSSGDSSGGTADAGTTTVSDDSSVLSMEVPSTWGEVDGAAQDFSGVTADAALTASADIARWREGYEEPGASILASQELAQQYTPEQLLDANDFSDGCSGTARESYDDGTYTGFVDAYVECGDAGTDLVVIAATPPNNEYMLVMLIQTFPDENGTQVRERIIQFSTIDEAILLGG